MNLEVSAICDIGCVRQNNEDMVVIHEILLRDTQADLVLTTNDNFWIGVADGMGGHEAGELASAFVLTKLRDAIVALPKLLKTKEVVDHIDLLCREIHRSLNKFGTDKGFPGLGTTFSGLLYYEGIPYIVNVGDSRVYRFRGGLLAQLTRDHSLSKLLNDSSIAANHLANSFGGAEKIFIDIDETSVFPGDRLLICSDGLSGEIGDEILEEQLSLGASAAAIVELAKHNGGSDNISLITITFSE